VETYSLYELAAEHIALAKDADNGRGVQMIHGGRGRALRQTVLALAAGRALPDHEAPGEATLQVLIGHVLLIADDGPWEGRPGDYLDIPAGRHSLEALEDSAVLLTVGSTAEVLHLQ
jgi:quercetin dioxygenase-like cupin family protein